jgi:hypothetical protein
VTSRREEKASYVGRGKAHGFTAPRIPGAAAQGVGLLRSGGEVHQRFGFLSPVARPLGKPDHRYAQVIVRLGKQLQEPAVPRLFIRQQRADSRPRRLQAIEQAQVIALRGEIVPPLVKAVAKRVQQVDGCLQRGGCQGRLLLLAVRFRLSRRQGRQLTRFRWGTLMRSPR